MSHERPAGAIFIAHAQVSTRLDTQRVKAFLGADVAKFETSSIASVLRVKAVHRFVAAAA
jgi:hypothetical protein